MRIQAREARRRLDAARRTNRRVRTGIVQAGYILGAVGLGILAPRLSVGATVDSRRVTELLIAVGAAFVPFMGIIYSLLFLVVQFGSTTFTPRLNLFRDSPLVWHGFSFFTAVIVFAFTAAFAVGKEEQTTIVVPIVLTLAVLAAIGVFRSLQGSAFRSIQLASTLATVSRRGREVIEGVYPDRMLDANAAGGSPAGSDAAVFWPARAATLQAIDVPALVRSGQTLGHHDRALRAAG